MVRAVLLVLLLVAPLGQASIILDDPQGDVNVAGTGTAANSRWSQADLLSLEIEETPNQFRFVLSTAVEPDPSRTYADDVTHVVSFRYGTFAYELRYDVYTLHDAFGSYYYAALWRQTSPDDYMRIVTNLEVDGQASSGHLSALVPRKYIIDELGVEPFEGSRLTDIRVNAEAYWLLGFGGNANSYDRMPDAGVQAYPVSLGVQQVGDIRLSSDERIRGSNGQATTYFWRVQLHNLNGTFDDEVTLSLLDVPDTWIARLPLATARVPAGEIVDIPILLTIPFAHQHGIIETFLLEARSLRDVESVGRLQLGVEFLDPAQPAGHHDRVYLHSSYAARPMAVVATFGFIYTNGPVLEFNTLSEDPRDRQEPVPGTVDTQSDVRALRAGWVVPLQPALRLGLNFDLSKEGTLEVPIESATAWTDGVLEGYILQVPKDGVSYHPPDYDGFPGVKVLADVGPVPLGAVGAARAVSAPIIPRPEADVVAYDPDQTLVALLWLHGNGPVPATYQLAPAVNPGGNMVLPLLEYHDAIDETFAAPDFLQVALTGSTERVIAPGTALLWDLHVRNGGERRLALDATVQGQFSEWVTFPAGRFHEVDPNETGVIPIAIRAPADAKPGDVADVEDPRIRGIVRVVATVAADGGAGDVIPEADQSATVDAIEREHNSKRSPNVGVLGALALLGAAFVARRRLQ